MVTINSNLTTTLGTLYTGGDYEVELFDPLMDVVEPAATAYCKEIIFSDINYKQGYLAIEFRVTTACYTGGWDRDEDGGYRDTENVTETITVRVDPLMTLANVASATVEEIRAIDENVFA